MPSPGTPLALPYRPVRQHARLGLHIDVATKALRNSTPRFANASIVGVWISGFTHPSASNRWSSVRMKMRLGMRLASVAARTAAPKPTADRPIPAMKSRRRTSGHSEIKPPLGSLRLYRAVVVSR